jgi:hypothetical protein
MSDEQTAITLKFCGDPLKPHPPEHDVWVFEMSLEAARILE